MISNAVDLHDWKDILIVECLKKGEFRHGEVSKFLREFSDRYGASYYMVRSHYYYEVKPLLDDPQTKKELEQKYMNGITVVEEEENDIESKEEDTVQSDVYPNPPPYKEGQVLDCVVKAIEPYGAFLKTLDEYGYEGLVHIRNLTGSFVTNVEKYLKVGDKIKARYEGLRKGKISFSTKDFIKPSRKDVYQKSVPARLNGIKDCPTGSENKIVNDTLLLEREMENILPMLNSIVGMITPQAEDLAKEIIRKHGVAKFMLAVVEVSKDFSKDLGYHFLKAVEEKARERL